jgi:hypothetical protein
MSLCLSSFVILGLTLGVAPAAPGNHHNPSINGRWQIVVFMADGAPLPSHALKDAEIQITYGEMTFRLPQRTPSVLDKRQLRFEFVDNGLDVTIPEIPHAAPMKGAWSMDQQTFQFCYATDERLGRPELRAGKGLIYLMLKRSMRRPEQPAQESLSQVVRQLKEIVRKHGSTEAGKKAKGDPTGTFFSYFITFHR